MSTMIDGELHLTRLETGVALVMALENRGATFELDENGDFRVDLDRCDGITTDAEAEDLVRIIFSLRAEVRLHLHARQSAVVH
jgi:hypothetical protein